MTESSDVILVMPIRSLVSGVACAPTGFSASLASRAGSTSDYPAKCFKTRPCLNPIHVKL